MLLPCREIPLCSLPVFVTGVTITQTLDEKLSCDTRVHIDRILHQYSLVWSCLLLGISKLHVFANFILKEGQDSLYEHYFRKTTLGHLRPVKILMSLRIIAIFCVYALVTWQSQTLSRNF